MFGIATAFGIAHVKRMSVYCTGENDRWTDLGKDGGAGAVLTPPN